MSAENTALLPIFRPSALDMIPISSMVLKYHELLELKVDMKYDQLRSPQVNALLIKPLVAEIRENHLSEGSLYAIIACMVQFNKEASLNVAMSGVCTTRATICEIVAMKLLKDYEPDDLVNALTFDFYPLANGKPLTQLLIPRWQRISALELAINAEAKKFLAHPVVTEVVEQIWNGSIMFQSSLNKLHRIKFANEDEVIQAGYGRRGPGVRYNYSNASILKLSRLRVPRYRSILNMLSFCVFLVVYCLVLSRHAVIHTPDEDDPEHSIMIPGLNTTEVLFSIMSLGLIIEEMVSLTDAGFELYVKSLWNLLDLTISILLVGYACLRIMALNGISRGFTDIITVQRTAKDILATIAIFMFPRLFSVLDTQESFSRMVVAVRKMFLDLAVAWLVIIVFSSGFWVAFTLAFARDVFSANQVAFDLLKILFGFTPAVWLNWDYYSYVGRCILLFYLFITHFVILTILIAVLSDSFSTINLNSREEHRFLFTVNTISMIKAESSTLFSYTWPLNIIEWTVRPLFYVLPLRQFLILNRTIIKLTHFPFLVTIFVYEKLKYSWILRHEKDLENSASEVAREVAQEVNLATTDVNNSNNSAGPVHDSATATATSSSVLRHDGSDWNSNKSSVKRASQVRKRSRAISNMDLIDQVFKLPYKSSSYRDSYKGFSGGISGRGPSSSLHTRHRETIRDAGSHHKNRLGSQATQNTDGDRMSDMIMSDFDYGKKVFESDDEYGNDSDNDGIANVANVTHRHSYRKMFAPLNATRYVTHRDSIASAVKPFPTIRKRSPGRVATRVATANLSTVPSEVAMDSMTDNMGKEEEEPEDESEAEHQEDSEQDRTIQDIYKTYESRGSTVERVKGKKRSSSLATHLLKAEDEQDADLESNYGELQSFDFSRNSAGLEDDFAQLLHATLDRMNQTLLAMEDRLDKLEERSN